MNINDKWCVTLTAIDVDEQHNIEEYLWEKKNIRSGRKTHKEKVEKKKTKT